LTLDAFQAFVRLTAPADLFTASQVRAIFQSSLQERGDGVERWGGRETISLAAFPNALARLALVGYNVSPYAEMWPTPRKKVEMYFERVLKVTPGNDVGCLRAQGVFSQAESRHDLPRSFVPPQRGRSPDRSTSIEPTYRPMALAIGKAISEMHERKESKDQDHEIHQIPDTY
jgi:hypothetical protein